MPTGVNVPLTFTIYKGGQVVRTETLTQDVVKIGKLSSSHLRIDDESVSRMHAVVEITSPTEIHIIDLGSTKGTTVNGKKVNKSRIQSGDEILIGDVKVTLTVGEAVTTARGGRQDQPPPPQARATMMGIATVAGGTGGAAATPGQRATMTSPGAARPATAPGSRPATAVPGAGRPTPSTTGRPGIKPAGAGASAIPRPTGAIPAPTGAIAQSRPMAAGGAPAGTARAPAAAQQPMMPAADPAAVEVRDGTRAIEVVAMFEDAIVETRYLNKLSLSKELKMVQPRTLAYLAGGVAGLLVSFTLFLVAYIQVGHIRHAREEWERTHPAGEAFPTQREGVAVDLVALALLLGGLAGTVRGAFRYSVERPSRDNIKDFVIGPDPQAIVNVPAEMLPVPAFPLVRAAGKTYELLFTPAMKGDVVIDGQQIPLADLAASGKAPTSGVVQGAHAFIIPEGARAKVDFGETTFLVNSVHPPRRYPKPFRPDWNSLAYTGGTAAVMGAFLAMIFSLPPDPKSLSLDSFMNDQRLAKFLIKPPEEKEEQIPEWLKKKGNEEAGGKGKRHKGDEGKMGKPTSKNKAGLYALKGPRDNTDVHLAKEAAAEAARSAGVLGILKQAGGGSLASIFGRDSALGNDAENVLGGLVGTQVGEAYGVGGLGLVGTGRGGGGTGEGTIGLGSLGTIGKGGGGGSGSGYGRGAGGLGGRRAKAPDVVPGTAQVRGALDKEIIRRVIRRHINEVKFCYEKELTKNPDLYGRVMVQFTIAGTGAVVASVVQQSTMNNPPVDECIAGAVRRWEFPKPQGGGIVVVSYPFVLKSASGGEE